MIDLKSEPELRHVIAHMMAAIEAAARGHWRAVDYELASVQELVFWPHDDSASLESELKAREYPDGSSTVPQEAEVQGEENQEEAEKLVQGEEVRRARRVPLGIDHRVRLRDGGLT